MTVVRDVKKLNIAKRTIAAILVVVCSFSCPAAFNVPSNVEAKDKVLKMKTARSLALQNSLEYDNADTKVLAKQSAYESAVKAIKIKQKNLSTFRWSPLLSFKFPTSPNFAQASEFQYKPVALSYDIKVAQHQKQDKVFAINEKVNNLFCEIVVLQETIKFNESRAKALEDGLAKNQAKLRIGQAKQADVDKMQKKLEATNNKIAASKSNLSADHQKLTKMIGLDVTTGYSFEKPFVEATIDRSMLDGIIQYTEDRDETYYEACIKEITARAELTTNADLVKNKYGNDYGKISTYVNAALNGGQVNKKAFKSDYKSFLEKIDSYWNGKKRIVWFKFPKLWFKGAMDGTRYIEDDPNALETNVLDYADAVNEKKAAKENLDQSVIDAFNNYISVRNSYQKYKKDIAEAEKNLKKSEQLNRQGLMSFEEYDSEMESYEELQNSLLDAMKLYTTTLYSFDRLTCGGISALLSGTDADLHTAVVGESYPEKKTASGAYYTLKSIIQKQEFELAVKIPDDFEVEISDYELWVDGVQVGPRTNKDKKLRHLALTVDGVNEVKIRLYDGEKFIDDCIIDPSDESGPLTITTGFEIKKNEGNKIGTYEKTVSDTTGILEIKFKMDKSDIKSFKVLTDDGKALGSDTPIDIGKSFKHLSEIGQSLGELKLEFYDGNGDVLYKGRFDVANGLVLKEDEE
ncbi:MAG: TolC family protein [Butyrivibrio sp.]|nr:TolC family protein [Butyrivibrio sp.]